MEKTTDGQRFDGNVVCHTVFWAVSLVLVFLYFRYKYEIQRAVMVPAQLENCVWVYFEKWTWDKEEEVGGSDGPYSILRSVVTVLRSVDGLLGREVCRMISNDGNICSFSWTCLENTKAGWISNDGTT